MGRWGQDMMKTIRLACLALAFSACQGPPTQQASSDQRAVDVILATDGLAAADAALTGRTRTAETSFQLGGIRFLRAIETVLQTRYQTYDASVPFIPGMAAPLPPNPNAKFAPDFLETALKGALEHLDGARAALAEATNGAFATELPLDVLWFDIDSDRRRSEWESFRAILDGIGAQADWASFDGKVRFDTADAEWLAAYVHLMSGASEMVLSVDPTSAIQIVYEGRMQLERAGAVGAPNYIVEDSFIDQAAAVLMALNGKPDAARTRKALDHFRQMIAHNRKFWPEVMAETDNDHEWLPNPRQTSPFGINITPEIATGWQEVLAELEDMLEGRALIPFWRTPPGPEGVTSGVGINLKRLLSDPPDLNVALLIQGAAIAPYLEQGKLVTLNAWNRFGMLTRGDGLLLAVILN
jgi:hypothetical protein